MIKKIRIIPAITLLLFSCQQLPDKGDIISVSIPPQKYLVEKIAGNKFQINILVPPGASPETYELSPGQMKMLADSRVFFITGHLSFEITWRSKIKSFNKDLVISDLSQGIDLISTEHSHGDHVHYGTDPHIWVSPKTIRIMAENIFRTFLSIDPDNEDDYRLGYEALKEEINRADSILEQLFTSSPRKSFLIFHPALGYLARDYNLEQIALEYEGKSPPPAYMQKIIDIAFEKNIRTVLIQKEFNIDNAKSLAREIKGDIAQIDPLAENWYDEIISIGTKLHQIFHSDK